LGNPGKPEVLLRTHHGPYEIEGGCMGQLKRQLLTWGAIVTTTAVLPGLALADNVSPEHGGGRHGRGHRSDENTKLAVAGRAISRGTTDSYGLQIRGRSGEQPTDAGGMIRFAHKGDKVMEGLVGEITCLSKDSAGIVSVTGTIKRSGKREGKGDKDDKKMPGLQTAAADDDGTALLDELAPWDADEAAEVEAADPTVPGAPAAPSLPGQDPNKDKDPNKKGPGKGERGKRGGGELAGKDFAFTIDVPGKPQKFSKPTIGDKGTLAACSGGADSVDVTRGGFKTRDADSKKSDGDNKDEKGGHRHGGRHGWHR
jgi:hypothetical protein